MTNLATTSNLQSDCAFEAKVGDGNCMPVGRKVLTGCTTSVLTRESYRVCP